MKKLIVNVENKTSPGVFSPSELKLLIEALHIQASQDFNTSPWVEHGYCAPIEVSLISNDKPVTGSCNIILLDDLTVEGALGYHEDVEGGKIPVSYVGVKESREDDVSVTAVASHEMVEMAVNSWVVGNNLRTVKHQGREYIVEIADPLQSHEYIIKNGQEVANFVWPKYYNMPQTRTRICQKTDSNDLFSLKPFELPPNGYMSSRPIGGGEDSWSEDFGDKRSELPKWASRLPRIYKATNKE